MRDSSMSMTGEHSRVVSHPGGGGPAATLRLLSYNIQTGIPTRRYREYVTGSWRHVLPFPRRLRNLDRMADLIRGYDIVGLQEADAGSLRCENVNLTEYLARRAGFSHWEDRTNRRIGRVARHSLGVLSRLRPDRVRARALPGAIPGRGALEMVFGPHREGLLVVCVHLALGRRTRSRQIEALCEWLRGWRYAVIMGDFNCRSDSPELQRLRAEAGLQEPAGALHTYPSWRPARSIDHILVSAALPVTAAQVLHAPLSDHLPIAMEISVPGDLRELLAWPSGPDLRAGAGRG